MNARSAVNVRRLLMPTGVALTLVAMAFGGCIDTTDDDGAGPGGTGTVSFYVKDAPADELESLFVTFSKVEVHKAGSGSGGPDPAQVSPSGSDDGNSTIDDGNSTIDDGNSTIDDGNSTVEDDNATVEAKGGGPEAAGAGWVVIVDSEHTVDLKAFSGDAKAFLGSGEVPEGKYTQIRIHVTESWGILAADGSRVEVKVPSDSLRITHPWTVEAGAETALIVDFDLAKSVLKLGNGDWLLKPVMHLMIEKGGQLVEVASDDARGGPPEGAGNGTGPGAAGHGRPHDAGPQDKGPAARPASEGKKNETEAAA